LKFCKIEFSLLTKLKFKPVKAVPNSNVQRKMKANIKNITEPVLLPLFVSSNRQKERIKNSIKEKLEYQCL